jgi:hypothetical protein
MAELTLREHLTKIAKMPRTNTPELAAARVANMKIARQARWCSIAPNKVHKWRGLTCTLCKHKKTARKPKPSPTEAL